MWVLVRIAGIIVGIATLLRLATTQGLVTYDPLFQEWMDRLQDLVELGFLTDLIEPLLHRFIDWVRSFGLHLPDLNDNWRPVFILASLYISTRVRHERNDFGIVPAGSFVVVGTLFSLSAALVAGLSTSVGIVAGFLVAQKSYNLLSDRIGDLGMSTVERVGDEFRLRHRPDYPIGEIVKDVVAFLSILCLAVAALVPSLELLALVPIANALFVAARIVLFVPRVMRLFEPALIALAFWSGIDDRSLLVSMLLYIAIMQSYDLSEWVSSMIRFGEDWKFIRENMIFMIKPQLDILSVLLGSLFIASIFASPPIW